MSPTASATTAKSRRSFARKDAERRRYSGTGLPRMRRSAASAAKGDMNVTPFIDVLLVLLVMLIMAVPIKLHETRVELPGIVEFEPLPIRETNTVYIDEADRLFWNGAAITSEELSTQISVVAALENEPVLRFEPAANASYDRAAKTIALIERAGAEKFAFVGNARHKDFGS